MMIIYNIREDIDVQIYLKNIDGSDINIFLKPGQFVFSPTDEKTKSINLQGIKRNIGIVMEEKPLDAEYFIIYDQDKRFFMYPEKQVQCVSEDKIDIITIKKQRINPKNKKTILFAKNRVNKAKKEFVKELNDISKECVEPELTTSDYSILNDILKEESKEEFVSEVVLEKNKKIKEAPVKQKKLPEPKIKIVSKPRNFILKNKKK
jgi:hypothetical protein